MASAKSTVRSTKFSTVPLLTSPVLQVGITGEPLSDQAPGRSLVYTDADPGSACPRAESPKFPKKNFDFPPAKRVLSTRSSKSPEIYPIKKVFFPQKGTAVKNKIKN